MRKKRKKSRKPNHHPTPVREEKRERENEFGMLSEFSDEYHDFYIDEVGATIESQEKLEEAVEKVPGVIARKKPVSPLRRKVRRILSFIAIITVVIVVGVVLSLTVLFKTQSYEVIGNSLYNESDIVDVCNIPEGTNIFLAPKKPAAERIKSSFPYFEDVKVGFKIPDTIKIEIVEAVEGYLVKISDKDYLVISTKGRILNRVSDKSAYDLPIFIGPKLVSGDIGDYVEYEDETIVDMIENITQVFADNGYQGITEVDATNPANITFTYDGRIKVNIGIPEDISYKIRTAMTIITTKIDVNPGSRICGKLDVSRCNDTKRSYFDEDKSIDVNATEDPSAPTQVTVDTGWEEGGEWTDDGSGEWTDDSGEQTDDGGGEWTDDNYEWTQDDGGWTDDGGDSAADGGEQAW